MTTPDLIAGAQDVYERSGIGMRVGFGASPAVVVVDFQNGFTDPESPVGGDVSDALAATARLLRAARAAHLPVAYTAVGFAPGLNDGATWLRKMPGLGALVEGTAWCEIDERVAPDPGEPVWIKRASSAFFGTPLIPFLTAARVDTVIVAGCVTSGCVRATTIDAVSWGYRTIVPFECVADRASGPHEWNLFDIDSKYADVLKLDEVLATVESVAGKVVA
jgi:nicotinamidase-related amidase